MKIPDSVTSGGRDYSEKQLFAIHYVLQFFGYSLEKQIGTGYVLFSCILFSFCKIKKKERKKRMECTNLYLISTYSRTYLATGHEGQIKLFKFKFLLEATNGTKENLEDFRRWIGNELRSNMSGLESNVASTTQYNLTNMAFFEGKDISHIFVVSFWRIHLFILIFSIFFAFISISPPPSIHALPLHPPSFPSLYIHSKVL